MESPQLAIETRHLTYTYPQTDKVGLADIDLQIPWGSRCLLIGPNGAGKSTLLRILAGKTLTKAGSILVGGNDPFRAGSEANGMTTYLGTEWASNEIVRRDIPVTVLIDSIGGGYYPERREELIKLLDIDIRWRMNNVSDGERRRVQLAMGLLKPWRLLLLDEVTVDLDVLVRSDLLTYLKKECLDRDCCVVYATHIFDGLGDWPTDIVHITGGVKKDHIKLKEISFEGNGKRSVEEVSDEKSDKRLKINPTNSLHPLALDWLKEDLEERGTREEDKNRPKWDDLKAKLQGLYYDGGDRVTDYFKSTRKF